MTDRSRLSRFASVTFFAVPVLAVVGWIHAIRACDEVVLEAKFFNYDTLFPFHIYKDVVEDGNPFSGWQLPIAPFAFPDIPLAGLSMFLTGSDALAAVVVYALLQLLFIVGGAAAISRVVNVDRRTVLVGAVLAFTLPLILSTWDLTHTADLYAAQKNPAPLIPGRFDTTLLLACQSHSGTFAVVLWATAAFLRILKPSVRPAGLLHWLFLSILVFLGMFGNLLFLTQFVLPSLVLCAWLWLRGSIPRFRSIGLAICIASCALGGRLTIYRLTHIGELELFLRSKNRGEVVKGLANGLRFDLWEHFDPTVALALVAFIVISCLVVRSTFRRANPISVGLSLGQLYCLSVAVTLASIVYAGVNVMFEGNRFGQYQFIKKYCQPGLFGPLLVLPVLFAWRFRNASARVCAALGLVLIIGWQMAVWVGMPQVQRPIFDYRPTYVRDLDDLGELQPNDMGVSEVWSSRAALMTSHKRLRVLPVHPGLEPHYWLGNRAWFAPGAGSADWREPVRFAVMNPVAPINGLCPGTSIATPLAVTLIGQPGRVVGSGEREIALGFPDKTLPSVDASLTERDHRPNAKGVDLASRIALISQHPPAGKGEIWRLHRYRVRVENRSKEAWWVQPFDKSGSAQDRISLGWTVRDPAGKLLAAGRVPLAEAFLPGTERAIDFAVADPLPKNATLLTVSLVQDGVRWAHEVDPDFGLKLQLPVPETER